MKLLPNLRKVRYATFGYRSQHHNLREELPTYPTRFSIPVDITDKVLGSDELLIDALRRKGELDVWEPYLVINFTKLDKLEFSGEEALKIWKAYQGIIYRKGK